MFLNNCEVKCVLSQNNLIKLIKIKLSFLVGSFFLLLFYFVIFVKKDIT